VSVPHTGKEFFRDHPLNIVEVDQANGDLVADLGGGVLAVLADQVEVDLHRLGATAELCPSTTETSLRVGNGSVRANHHYMRARSWPTLTAMARGGESFPSELLWVSRRRTEEIVDIHVARKPRWRAKGGKLGAAPVPLAPSAGVEFEPAPTRTLADYAVQATEDVRHETGSLQRPDRFVQMTLDYVHLATFEVPFAWPDGSQQRVSTLFASQWVEGVGRVFVALFGSPHNILVNREPAEYHTGRVPSNANGLYRIIDAMREPDEVQLLPKTLDSGWYENDVDDARRADLAAEVIYGLSDPLPAQRLTILAEPFSLTRNHTLSSTRHDEWPPRPFELLLVGTAIWAGTPSSKADLAINSGRSDESRRLWPVLNAHLYEFLDAWRRDENPEIPDICRTGDEAQWKAYASWFVNLGRQIGQVDHELRVCRRPSKWDPLRYLARSWQDSEAEKPTGQFGFLLPRSECDGSVLVTEAGGAIPVLGHDHPIYWPGGGKGEWLEPQELPMNVGAEEFRRVRATMWLQHWPLHRNHCTPAT